MVTLGVAKARWAAQIILCHAPECQPLGTREYTLTRTHTLTLTHLGTVRTGRGSTAVHFGEHKRMSITPQCHCPAQLPIKQAHSYTRFLTPGRGQFSAGLIQPV